MNDQVVITHSPIGHGRDVSNHAIFTSRIKFAPVHTEKFMNRICNALNTEVVEPELAQLEKVDGISKLAVYEHDSLYNLCVSKASSYTWDELTPQILELLDKRYERLIIRRAETKQSHFTEI